MAQPRDKRSPNVEEDLDYQRREWAFERAGWVAMAAIVAAALAGLLGSGPLSGRTARSPDGALTLEYPRFARFHGPVTLVARLAEAGEGELRLAVASGYLEAVQLTEVTPQPLRVEAGADRHVFVFRAAPPAGSAAVCFHLEPDRIGTLTGWVRAGDGPTVEFHQFVYP